MNKILRKIRKTFYLNQIKPGPRFGRLLQILDHFLKLIYLGCQLYYKLFVALVASRHRIQGLLQGVYHIYKTPI